VGTVFRCITDTDLSFPLVVLMGKHLGEGGLHMWQELFWF
jgi:hypothetical protein